MSDPAFKAMSIEAYLQTEAKSPFKREYVGGFVYALHGQAGVSRSHSLVCGNIFAALHTQSRHQNCRLHQTDMRLYIDERSSYYYPDVMLVCETETGDELHETAPCLLIEVLSKGTASLDRVGKYGMYTALPSLQTYLMVEQAERRVYIYTREGEKWSMREVTGGPIPVACLNMELTLEDIYAGVL